jgi:hypothetical protein
LMKVADFNGDGILDVAAITGDLTILLGNPDGTFTPKSATSLSGIIRDLTVADFNGDGIPDIAVLQDGAPSTVAVFLGRGDGNFTSEPPIPIFSFFGAYSIVSGDFNEDGNPDLLMTNYNDGSIALLLGNGKGEFRAGPSANLGGQGGPAIVADFNGDGIPDVATLNYASESFQFSVYILSGNGDGTFATSGVSLPCDPSGAFAVADFNGDGFQDIVASPCFSVYTTDSWGVDMLLGNGNGTFTSLSLPALPIAPIEEPAQAATGDLNGDGIPDLVITNTSGAEIGILLGKGDGTFATGPILQVPGGAWAGEAAVADFNGDGLSDLLIAASPNSFTWDVGTGPPIVNDMFEWFSSVAQTSHATATKVTPPGSGAQQVYALYHGDTTHIGSYSATAPAASAEPTDQQQ